VGIASRRLRAYPLEWFGAFAELCEAADAVCDEIERFLGSESRP